MEKKERNKVVTNLKKLFKKPISTSIENSIYNFTQEYVETQNIPYLFEQIYNEKLDEIMLNIEKNEEFKINIENKIIDVENIAYLKPQELDPELYSKILRKKELEEYNLNNKASTNIFKCAKCNSNSKSLLLRYSRYFFCSSERFSRFISIFSLLEVSFKNSSSFSKKEGTNGSSPTRS